MGNIRHAYHQNMVKPFGLFVFLKLHSSGKLHQDSPVFEQAKKELRIKDRRTFEKYIQRLLQEGWIGYNKASGYYFIKSFSRTPIYEGFVSKTAVILLPAYLKNIQAFLVGAIVGERIKHQQFVELAQRRRRKLAIENPHIANTADALLCSYLRRNPDAGLLPYHMLSNKRIAEILGCKQTRACVLKRQAASYGFLRLTKKYRHIAFLDKADFELGRARYQHMPNGHKLLFRTVEVNGIKKVELVEQLPDEITPLLKYQSVKTLLRAKRHALPTL